MDEIRTRTAHDLISLPGDGRDDLATAVDGTDVTRAVQPSVSSRYTTRYVTVHGYRRAYIRAGRGPALLLIHGVGDNSQSWRGLVPLLARGRTVIVPDLLGHGESDKPRGDYSIGGYACGMRDLLTVLGIDRVTVVGHSLGGGIAMQFAYQFPERCERVVLVATGGVCPDLHPVLRTVATTPGSGLVLSLATASPLRQVGWAVTRTLRWLRTDLGRDADDLMRMFDNLHVNTARAAFLRTLRSSVDSHGQAITMLDRCYLAAGMPYMIIWGEHDAVIPVEHARIAHAAMPSSRLEIFEGAGHFPHHSDPERFRAVLEDFLATTRPATYSARQWRDLLCSRGRVDQRPTRERDMVGCR
ncbi:MULTISPECIES: alpha/beta fold hydrolase [Protofrankia]|uniref:Alpha/beta hydrolase fold protein n=1 Tax=Candidatus Protofrankia datiscae TaxID=2716812 RepID=F8AXA9_9ACTN|nr:MULTISPECIES: alpha/beta hydrolase [Protofrankia]AEH08462.1 alpha/beta hydrolase fold protein [Candidatus Protofrankia datiscae]